MKMAKLTDTQLIILSKAVAREDGAAIVPEKLNRGAATKVGSSLVARKLMREMRSKPGMPVWREDADLRTISLCITRAGRAAIGVDAPAREATSAVMSRKGGRKTVEAPDGSRGHAKVPPRKNNVADVSDAPLNITSPRMGSKQAMVIGMLSEEAGAKLDDLVKATGWLPHTTRAALTGLRKRGFAVERSRDGKDGSIYRITGQPTCVAA